MNASPTPTTLPILPLRDIVVFPHMIVPLFVGREKSIKALEAAMRAESGIVLVTQKDTSIEDPNTTDFYTMGTIGTILQMLKLPDGTVKVLVEGRERSRINKLREKGGFFEADIAPVEEDSSDIKEIEAKKRVVVSQFEQYIKLNRKTPPEVMMVVSQIDEPSKLADTVASHLVVKIEEKQKLLEMLQVSKRLELVFGLMEGEISLLQVEKKIRNRVKRQMEKTQKDYYLNEQMKAIQKELGDGEDGKSEITELEAKIKKTKFSAEAKDKIMAEMKKLKNMSPMSAEATVVRNYIDWLVSIPWHHLKKIKSDVKEAQRVLDEDHFGLEKVKDRIVEYLAVQQRVQKMRGSILCLVGPPGVGKTSLGKSIARATGREFVRISLGGVRDEAEIRGHRRTYIGAMPGKIIQAMKKAKVSNPLFLLDEMDKIGQDWRGDPASALLEVLDPEQNSTFNDHYLEVDYDLSDVMFVTTANTLNIPPALLDRMEIIRIPGYTEQEKMEIAIRHLIPKQLELHGAKKSEIAIADSAVCDLIRYYTRESGVRNLEREIANLIRKALKKILINDIKKISLTSKNIEEYAGVKKYDYGRAEVEDLIGVSTGLAWTEVGGDLLSIEAVRLPGKGKMTITGKLGDVMQESVQAALSYVRSQAADYGIKPSIFDKSDFHIHVPEGATPKDGPSAGIAICTSIVSMLTANPIRKDLAMTGEITLRGRVLGIGGLKEKLLAALRGGIKTVLIPHDNVKDLADIPDNVKNNIEIIPVKTLREVLGHALKKKLKPIKWTADDEAKMYAPLHTPPHQQDDDSVNMRRH